MGQVLLLNADAQPVSYLPLSAIQWQDAITYLWLDKVTVLEWYDDWMVRSDRWETRVCLLLLCLKKCIDGDGNHASPNTIFISATSTPASTATHPIPNPI